MTTAPRTVQWIQLATIWSLKLNMNCEISFNREWWFWLNLEKFIIPLFANSEEGDKWTRFSMNMAMVMIGSISDELVIITWHIIIVACTMFTYTHS